LFERPKWRKGGDRSLGEREAILNVHISRTTGEPGGSTADALWFEFVVKKEVLERGSVPAKKAGWMRSKLEPHHCQLPSSGQRGRRVFAVPEFTGLPVASP